MMLNPTDKKVESSETEWLTKFANVFCEELLELPPKHEVNHSIELTRGAQSIAERPYKVCVGLSKGEFLFLEPRIGSYVLFQSMPQTLEQPISKKHSQA